MIHVQKYLLTHSLQQLKEEHGIKSSGRHGDYLFSLNYDQIESKPSPMVNQCRGVVLATVDKRGLIDPRVVGSEPVGETIVMARPFDRFFNLGDVNAAPVDFTDPETVFFEKLDGTLCILYFDLYAETWNVATRAVPRADKNITGWEGWTFRKLFEKALYDTMVSEQMVSLRDTPENWTRAFDVYTRSLDKHCTYVFELTTPLNRIVVEYKDYRVHLLGVRANSGIMEFDPRDPYYQFFGVPACPSHKLSNQEELLAFVGSKPPFEQEGLVVRDKNFNRVKVKSLAYSAYNRVRDSTANSPRAIVELILTEKLDDVMPVLENYVQKEAVRLQQSVRKLVQKVDEDFKEIVAVIPVDTLNPRKDFALGVQARKAWMAPLMDLYLKKSGATDFSGWLQSQRNVDGSYPDGLLDRIIDESKKCL